MRPVERGPDPGPFSDYKQARDPLIGRIGDYCSYCENALHSEIDVEHVQPKSLSPYAELVWTNFLLACGYCNAVKGHNPVSIADYFWPDADNTFRAFKFDYDMPPTVADGLSQEQQTIALRTLELTGIDRGPGHHLLTKRDRRWIKRREAWGAALHALSDLNQNDTIQLRNSIISTALARGFWSVWMTVFQHHPEMRRRLIQAFPNTAVSCFDDNGNSIPRPGGQI